MAKTLKMNAPIKKKERVCGKVSEVYLIHATPYAAAGFGTCTERSILFDSLQ